MWSIRPVRTSDAEAIAAIYAPIVERTVISFEETPPSADEMRRRIERVMPRYPWLVADQDGDVIGYAYASPHRDRAAYRWSADVSAYVHERARRSGVASSLYGALFAVLEAQGFHSAFAGITLPNDASIGLHSSRGFERVGIYREVGYKLGAWRDTSWWRRPLRTTRRAPNEPIGFSELGPDVLARAFRHAAPGMAQRST